METIAKDGANAAIPLEQRIPRDKNLKYIPLFRNWLDGIVRLRDNGHATEACDLLVAAFEFAETGRYPKGLSVIAATILDSWRPALERNMMLRRKKAENGAKGGMATGVTKARFGNQNARRFSSDD